VRLDALLPRLPAARLEGDPTTEVTGITHDSRRVEPGWVFAALPGLRRHGLEFLDEARARGAAAVLTDRRPAGAPPLPWIVAADPRAAAARAAWALAGDPQERLVLAGITGTNGKSTVADLLARCLEAAGRTVGVFGTLAYRLPGLEVPAERTTPEATDLAPLLARLAEAGGEAAVLEVSSHALALGRVAGLAFRTATFTNLSRDHLDYHGDMEAYFAAKRRLFEELLAPEGVRVLPADEPWGRRLLERSRPGDVTYGLGEGRVHAGRERADLRGTRCELVLDGRRRELFLPLPGRHNLRNALAAAATALALGVPDDAIVAGLEGAAPLPGRLERVEVELPFPVFVDYAHTPDGLRAVLEALREAGARRLVVVFGAGGDRDPGKRRPMGEAVGRLADVAVVTSDNPRSEDPAAIAAAVAEGVRAAGAEPLLELDRRRAIALALELADPSSVVVIAGKGHERVQVLAHRTVPFSDAEVVRELAGGVRCG